MTTIAVTGGSGNLGRATIQFLAKRKVPPASIVLVVRDPSKVQDLAAQGFQVRQGDYTDAASLLKSFQGVDKILFVSTSALGEERMRHHRNVVEAARAASVQHILYTSVVKPAAAALFAATPGHFQTEALIRDSGVPYTFFRNNLYMDLIPLLYAGAVESGVLLSCAGQGRVGFVARADIAEALAAALTSDQLRSDYNITTSRPAYSLAEVAAALGKARGKTINYVSVPANEFRQTLEGFRLPNGVIEFSVALGEAMRAGEFDIASNDLRELLGRAPVELESFLAAGPG
jgi:NAD(P)H dehydrogenase (quinone)